MEIKPWNEYSVLEKKALLNLWFYYTNPNQKAITEEETEKFHDLLDQDVDLIMHLVVCQTMNGQSSESVLLSMRSGTIDTVLNDLPEIAGTEDYEYAKKLTITILVGFYESLVACLTEHEPINNVVPITRCKN
ncbi:MAG: hypothetical protein K2I72_02360 [Bacilli bacterium]|nr:hypothetical protein [Bacilli bacterium]